jgi:hypothetical protein
MTEAELRALVKARLKSKTPREWIISAASVGNAQDQKDWRKALFADDKATMIALTLEAEERKALAAEILNGF